MFARAGTVGGDDVLQIAFLHRVEGWMGTTCPLPWDLKLEDFIVLLLLNLLSSTIHVRLYIYVDEHLLDLHIPSANPQLWHQRAVCEVSIDPWMCSPECSAFSEGVGWPPIS